MDSKLISKVMAEMGRRGGPARAKALSAQRRQQIARKAARARWEYKTAKVAGRGQSKRSR